MCTIVNNIVDVVRIGERGKLCKLDENFREELTNFN